MALPDNHYTVTQDIPSENTSITLYSSDNIYPAVSSTAYIVKALYSYAEEKSVDINTKSVAVFGAGAGYVPIVIKKTFPSAEITAYENDALSQEFLAENAKLHEVSFSKVNADVRELAVDNKFDIIVAAPAYLPDVIKNLPIAHAWDKAPEHTIYGGYKGMDQIKSFIDSAVKNLKKDGILVVLHSKIQTAEVADYLNANFTDITNINNDGVLPNIDIVDPSFTAAIKK